MSTNEIPTKGQNSLPDLSGEWTMKIQWQRGEEGGTVTASANIRHSPAGLALVVRSQGSNSHTIMSQAGYDAAGFPVLHYIYEVEPKAIGSDAKGPYKGAAILRLYDNDQELSGNYWTSQLTKGHFQLNRKPREVQTLTEKIDVLLVTAIPLEYEAAKTAFSETSPGNGVKSWQERNDASAPYLVGTYLRSEQELFRLAIAKPDRMGSIETGRLAATLIERLSPRCLVMCGVCAGNPGDVALGDLVVSELAYQHDEGKREIEGFVADHRQSPVSIAWKRAAGELKGAELPSYGPPSARDARYWLLERLNAGDNPRNHPARDRYFKGDEWRAMIETLEKEGMVEFVNAVLKLTPQGTQEVQRSIFLDTVPPEKLPIAVKVGPIASGNMVVKDGVTWEYLKQLGVRSVLGLEMEAATIGAVARASGVPEWLVIKGVMDHADPRKDDRYKPFAARASAEALRLFLDRNFSASAQSHEALPNTDRLQTPTLSRQWQPRNIGGVFFDTLLTEIGKHAPKYFGLVELALREAKTAYICADSAYEVAENARRLLSKRIVEAHSSELGKAPTILDTGTRSNGRQLIAKIWDSHDEYLGEAVDGVSDGLGVLKVYQLSRDMTPSLTSSFAGQMEVDAYGPSAVYTFPDKSQFAGAWTSGHPAIGYREYLGKRGDLDCDFYLGEFGLRSGSTKYSPIWVPHGKGVAVDASARHLRCGQLDESVFDSIDVEFKF
ncbi:phosphorylase family protein [Rhizobium leguminosarum]|uniref:Cap15 family cyclic dinucleotide receptor domain-containing protein n=1 Tax=Rhizobium leguminosarum TaxID=384 RepID=UPI003F95584D